MTALCGQLAALKIQTFRVKAKKGEKVSVSQEQSSKHGGRAEREHLCFTKVLARSSSITAGSHIWSSANLMSPLTAMTKRTLSQAGNCKVSHK